MRPILSGLKRIIFGRSEDEHGGLLQQLGERLPNVLTNNAKAWSGGGVVLAYQELKAQLGFDLGEYEWIVLVILTGYAVWRIPNTAQ